MPLTRDEINDIDCHVQRAGAANCWTGTSGSLAADARRLIRHIRETTNMDGYPADHILKGERELRGVDEIESRKAAAATAVRPGTDKFLAVLQEIADLHMRKSLDYGVDEDALANIRAGGEAIGVDPWKGCVLRISDKMQRLKAFCRRGTCEFDGVEDTLADIAAYAAIALVMVRESAPPPA